MRAYKLIYDESTFGVTGKALKMLRNAIVDNLRDEILILEVPTSDILCGFLVLNKTEGSATWSGDGFRTDKGGEGGRGYGAALKMLNSFGINYVDRPRYSEHNEDELHRAISINTSDAERDRALLNACNNIAKDFEDEEFKCYYEAIPHY